MGYCLPSFSNPPIIAVESFNGRLRDECLNEEVFATLAEARAVIERWRIDYNHVRPHSAHGGLTPEAVRLNPAAVRLRNLISSAARPLPPATQISYQPPGSHNDRGTSGGTSDGCADRPRANPTNPSSDQPRTLLWLGEKRGHASTRGII